ncbi:MAG: CD225/dispanin family protein [Gordonia sp. (in: high G+C Gram-positive bacteria)]
MSYPGQWPPHPDDGQPLSGQAPYGQPQYGQAPYGQPLPGAPLRNPYGHGPQPSNSLGSSITCCVVSFATAFLCCNILGLISGPLSIVAIVKGNAVGSNWRSGRMVEAQRDSDDARTWAMISWIVFGVGVVIGAVLMAIYGWAWLVAMSASTSNSTST